MPKIGATRVTIVGRRTRRIVVWRGSCLVTSPPSVSNSSATDSVCQGLCQKPHEARYQLGTFQDRFVTIVLSEPNRTMRPAVARDRRRHPYLVPIRMLRGRRFVVGSGRQRSLRVGRKHEPLQYGGRTLYGRRPLDPGQQVLQCLGRVELLLDRGERAGDVRRIEAESRGELRFFRQQFAGGDQGV